MNRNNGRKIAERLMLLQDFFIKNADKTHAVCEVMDSPKTSEKGLPFLPFIVSLFAIIKTASLH